MIAPALLPIAALLAPSAEVTYVEQGFSVPGELLTAQTVDVDGDGRLDLLLAVLERATRRRVITVRPGGADGLFAIEPATTVQVLDDIVAFGVAEVRDDPGRELIFLTRDGAWAYSPTKRGYKDNIERLVGAELLYDVPDPQALPYWEYVLPHAGGDHLLLPEAGGFRIWGPAPPDAERAPGAPRYIERLADFSDGRPAVRVGGGPPDDPERDALLSAALELTSNLFGYGDKLSVRSFLEDDVSTRAPALADVDGDGRLDMLVMRDDLRVYLAGPDGLPAVPTRIETFPDSMAVEEGGRRDVDLVDVDADGDVDVVLHLRAARDDLLGNRVHDVLVLRNDGRRLLPAVADDLRRVEAAWADVQVTDVDGDGRPDLVLEKAESPSQLELIRSTNPKIETTLLVFRGGDDGRFARKPDVESHASLDFAELGDAVGRSDLGCDCDGDGIHDQVDVDLEGNVSIRRLRRETGFFGGVTWSLDATPWKTFPRVGSFRVLEVGDVNGDGLGDVLTSRGDRVTVLLSRRPGGAR